jgi:hypothetical protein
MGIPGIAVQLVDEANSESAIRFLIEWVDCPGFLKEPGAVQIYPAAGTTSTAGNVVTAIDHPARAVRPATNPRVPWDI